MALRVAILLLSMLICLYATATAIATATATATANATVKGARSGDSSNFIRSSLSSIMANKERHASLPKSYENFHVIINAIPMPETFSTKSFRL